jgi:hypothetical protein
MLRSTHEWREAKPEFRRAIELNPNSANAHYFYAFTFLMPLNGIDQSPEKFPRGAVARPSFSHCEHQLRADAVGGQPLARGYRATAEGFGAPSLVGPGNFYAAQIYANLAFYPEAVGAPEKASLRPTAAMSGVQDTALPVQFVNGGKSLLVRSQPRRKSCSPRSTWPTAVAHVRSASKPKRVMDWESS